MMAQVGVVQQVERDYGLTIQQILAHIINNIGILVQVAGFPLGLRTLVVNFVVAVVKWM